MCHFFETLCCCFCLHVGYFHCSETLEVNFGVLDVDILFLMITCQCIETKSVTSVNQFFLIMLITCHLNLTS